MTSMWKKLCCAAALACFALTPAGVTEAAEMAETDAADAPDDAARAVEENRVDRVAHEAGVDRVAAAEAHHGPRRRGRAADETARAFPWRFRPPATNRAEDRQLEGFFAHRARTRTRGP